MYSLGWFAVWWEAKSAVTKSLFASKNHVSPYHRLLVSITFNHLPNMFQHLIIIEILNPSHRWLVLSSLLKLLVAKVNALCLESDPKPRGPLKAQSDAWHVAPYLTAMGNFGHAF